MLDAGAEWLLNDVYGPQKKHEKEIFLEELKGLKNVVAGSWLITHDFNLVYKVSDKNNSRLDRRLMGKLWDASRTP